MKKNFIKVLSLLLACLLLCSTFAGCTKNEAKDSDETRTIVDMLGNEVVIPAKVDKVMMHWASGVTLAMNLGATNKLTVIPTAFDDETFYWARSVCPELSNVARSTEAFQNPETALTYNPDVIIANDKSVADKFVPLGIPVVYVDIKNNESYKKALLIVGEVLGEEEYACAQKYNNYFDSNVQMVTDRLKDMPEEGRKNVYYLDSRFGDAYHTVGAGELQEDWITLGGGKLATAEHFQGKNLEIATEKFLDIDPEIIIVAHHKQGEVYDLLMNDIVLQDLSAIKNGKVYRNPYGIFSWGSEGSEAALQVVWIAKLLHPEKFEDVDIRTITKNFYKEFYGVDVSDETLDGILAGKLCPTSK